MKKYVVGIIILLLVGVNVSGDIDTKESTSTVFDGNILYVGGSGPNNYTTIQSAVDDALDGDTVFVYSGFYDEGDCHINKSIKLIGEDKNSTIVGSNKYNVLFYWWSVDNNTVNGFTFKDSSYGLGFYYSDNNIISNNIFENISKHCLSLYSGDNNQVCNNVFLNSGYEPSDYKPGGIFCGSQDGTTIEYNIFDNNNAGVSMYSGYNNFISNNIIINNNYGIYFRFCDFSNIVSNHIENNFVGVLISFCMMTLVKNNNIYDNRINGMFEREIISVLNRFQNNYWDSLNFIRKRIFGKFYIEIDNDGMNIEYFVIPWCQFDWNPASEPYDIEVL